MFGIELNDAVIVRQQQALEAALSTNPKTQKALQKLIRKVVLEARAKVSNSIHFNNGDPRRAAKSVRTIVYKKVLGANINIMSSRKAHDRNTYEPPRKLREGQRGGNRVPRSARTDQMMHYGPLDRGFILRFVNSGTKNREAGTRSGRLSGNRGSIQARHFFQGKGEQAMTQAADNLAVLIETELANIMNKKS